MYLHKRVFASVAMLAAAFVVMLSFAIGGQVGRVQAQGTASSPVASPAAESHPAHIHDGSCPEVGDVVYPLNNLEPGGAEASPAADHEMMMSTPAAGGEETSGQVVASSTTDVEASLDDILSGERAINVHESNENIQTYIACGNLTGEPENGTLEVELQEVDGSGYVGEAYLTDNGDGTTTVSVELMQSTGATPEASPVS
jgi:hypothetical protein